MNEMKDRLARALWQRMSDLWARQGMPLCDFDDPEAVGRGKQDCIDTVDIVFRTIREPTDAMVDVGWGQNVRSAWRDMVDEAMK